MSRSELGTRLIFAPLMLAMIGGLYYVDSTFMAERGMRGTLVAAVLGLLAIGGAVEYVAMFRKAGHAIAGRMLIGMTAVLCLFAFNFGWTQVDRELYPIIIATFALLFPIAIASLSKGRMQRGLEMQGATLLGFIMIAWPLYLAQGMALRHLPSVLFVVLVCKLGDIGAYCFGVAFGRHKLIPHISAGKTVEGSIGGVVVSCAAAATLAPWLLAPAVPITTLGAILLGVLLNLTTQTGDLIESLLKRRCGVKDSSNMLPAHGGILDLIDSLLFSFPAHFLVLVRLT